MTETVTESRNLREVKKKSLNKASKDTYKSTENKSKAKMEEPAIDLASEGWRLLRHKGIPAEKPSHVIYNFPRHSKRPEFHSYTFRYIGIVLPTRI